MYGFTIKIIITIWNVYLSKLLAYIKYVIHIVIISLYNLVSIAEFKVPPHQMNSTESNLEHYTNNYKFFPKLQNIHEQQYI